MQVESFYLSAFCQSLDKSIVARTEESDSKNKTKKVIYELDFEVIGYQDI